jgi:hypothetical protein
MEAGASSSLARPLELPECLTLCRISDTWAEQRHSTKKKHDAALFSVRETSNVACPT